MAFASDYGNARYFLDIYVKDMTSGTLTRVTTGNAPSNWPVISGDGRHIAFHSLASNLVDGDSNGLMDVFVSDWDPETEEWTTTRISESSGGDQGNGQSYFPSISENGRFVAFESLATNLVSGDNGGWWDIFVKNTVTGSIVRVSTDATGIPGNRESQNAAIADGKYVAFVSPASNLKETAPGVRRVYRVMNPLGPGYTVVDGTTGNDVLAITTYVNQSPDDNFLRVVLNGGTEDYRYSASEPRLLTFNGMGGDDQITMTGGESNESVVTCPTSLTFTFSGAPGIPFYQIIANDINRPPAQGSSIEVDAGLTGTGKTATMYDVLGAADTFTCYPYRNPDPAYSTMAGEGYSVKVTGFGVIDFGPVTAYASGDAEDTCKLYDSSGGDTFTAKPAYPYIHVASKATMRAQRLSHHHGVRLQ